MGIEKSVEQGSSGLRMKVSGFFDETADFGKYNFKKIKTLQMDFAKLERINSRGTLTWVRWFHDALWDNPELSVTFANCPPVLVNQFNNISNFIPKGAQVKSFGVPMVCGTCGAETIRMLVEGMDYIFNPTKNDYDVTVPEVRCEICRVQMDPGFFPNKYFQFLKRLGPVIA